MASTMASHTDCEAQGKVLETTTSSVSSNHAADEAKNSADLACNHMYKQDAAISAMAPQVACTLCRTPSQSCRCQHRLSLLSSRASYSESEGSEAEGSDLSTPANNTSATNSRATTSHGRAEGVEATDFAKGAAEVRTLKKSRSWVDPRTLPSMLDLKAPLPQTYQLWDPSMPTSRPTTSHSHAKPILVINTTVGQATKVQAVAPCIVEVGEAVPAVAAQHSNAEPAATAADAASVHSQRPASVSGSFVQPATLPSMLDTSAPLTASYTRSIASSLCEAAPRGRNQQPWFETEEAVSFQFKLTPKSSKARLRNAPKANADGSVNLLPLATSAEPEPTSGKGSSLAGLKITDQAGLKRVLTGALFSMLGNDMPKNGETRVLNLGLADGKKVSKAVAPLADAEGRVKDGVVQQVGEMETVQWKVVITPADKKSKEGDRKCLLPRYK